MRRSDGEIAEFIQRCFADVEFESDVDADLEGAAGHKVYVEEIPRVREVYLRCEEQLCVLEKRARSVFEVRQHIVSELAAMREALYGRQELERSERPRSMANEWQRRLEVDGFVGEWRRAEQTQMYCFYKFWALALHLEHLDVVAALDVFDRFDVAHAKFRKVRVEYAKALKAGRGKGDGKGGGVEVVEEDEEEEDGKQSEEASQTVETGAGAGGTNDEDAVKQRLRDSKALLDTLCTVILKQQVPTMWQQRVEHFQRQVQRFCEKYTAISLEL